jgi:hypothetical protein
MVNHKDNLFMVYSHNIHCCLCKINSSACFVFKIKDVQFILFVIVGGTFTVLLLN